MSIKKKTTEIHFSNRFAKTHKMLWGEDAVIPLGILLDVNVNAETFYNGIDTVTAQPLADHYTVLEVRKDETGKNSYRVCESVTMILRGEMAGKPVPAEGQKIHMAI